MDNNFLGVNYYNDYIVKLVQPRYNKKFEKYLDERKIKYNFLRELQLYLITTIEAATKSIKNLYYVDTVLIDIDIKVDFEDATPSIQPPQLGFQYCNKGIQTMTVPLLWESTLKPNGQGINVAIIDSGIGPHFALNISKFQANFVADEDFKDQNGHGTLIAGIIGARQFKPQGVNCIASGVAYNCNLMNVKIFNKNGLGKFIGFLSAINWCIANKANIAMLGFSFNKSLEKEYTNLLSYSIKTASKKKIIFVGMTGNTGDEFLLQPSNIDPVIPCGSVASNLVKSSFSNYGIGIKFVAPGEYIYSTYPKNTYMYSSGTSMAAAQLAGLIALFLSQDPKRTQKDIEKILISNAFLPFAQEYPVCGFYLGPTRRDTYNLMYGYGEIQAM